MIGIRPQVSRRSAAFPAAASICVRRMQRSLHSSIQPCTRALHLQPSIPIMHATWVTWVPYSYEPPSASPTTIDPNHHPTYIPTPNNNYIYLTV
mgnify:CR=1 FL=1